LIVHVHSTEFDRSGEHVNQAIYDIERRGMHGAVKIIAVSHLTKKIITDRYGVPAEKVEVIHNGIEPRSGDAPAYSASGRKTVLFLGRITMQKGPEFFIRAAERVLRQMNGVRFVMAGWGDLGPQMIELVAAMGLGRWVFFTGFLKGKEVDRAYRMADAYVMPSVSEPFGLTALEAIELGIPTVVSRNSGVAEVLSEGALKVDFWDVEDMAEKILLILNRPALAESPRRNGLAEVSRLRWADTAEKCVAVYHRCIESIENRQTGGVRTQLASHMPQRRTRAAV
jgi:glycosyltransferase involved in cell wall biosynthesis